MTPVQDVTHTGLKASTSPEQPHFRWAFHAGLAAATYLAVFRLPFLFPPTYKTVSASYSAGFSNQVATLSAALLAMMCFLLTWRFGARTASLGEPSRMSRAFVCCAGLGYLALYGLLAVSIYDSVRYYVDHAYFLERLGQMDAYGRMPYRDFAFGYGPLMLYLPLAVKKLGAPVHLTLQASFDLSLMAMALMGVWMVFKLVEALIADREYKKVVFVLFSLSGLNVCMVMSYTFFRFAIPYYGLLNLDRIAGKKRSAVALAIASTVVMSVSPEVGIAFSFGAMAYYLLRAKSGDWRWIGVAIIAWSGIAVMVVCCGQEYVNWLWRAGTGGYYFLTIAPVPHIVLFLVALVFIVPVGMAQLVKSDDKRKIMLAAFCVTALVMLSPTLGTADSTHVFFNGFGILLLSTVFAANFTEAKRMAWTASLAIVLCFGSFCLTVGYASFLATAAERDLSIFLPRETAHRAVAKLLAAVPIFDASANNDWGIDHDAEAIDDAGMATIPGHGIIATPFRADSRTDRALMVAGRYHPEFYFGFVGLPDAKTEEKKIRDMDEFEWTLIPDPPAAYRLSHDMLQLIYMFPVNYVDKRKCYEPGALLLSHLDTDWTRVRKIGRYWLYHNGRYYLAMP